MSVWKKKPQRIEAYEIDEEGNKRLVLISEDQTIPENIILEEEISNG